MADDKEKGSQPPDAPPGPDMEPDAVTSQRVHKGKFAPIPVAPVAADAKRVLDDSAPPARKRSITLQPAKAAPPPSPASAPQPPPSMRQAAPPPPPPSVRRQPVPPKKPGVGELPTPLLVPTRPGLPRNAQRPPPPSVQQPQPRPSAAPPELLEIWSVKFEIERGDNKEAHEIFGTVKFPIHDEIPPHVGEAIAEIKVEGSRTVVSGLNNNKIINLNAGDAPPQEKVYAEVGKLFYIEISGNVIAIRVTAVEYGKPGKKAEMPTMTLEAKLQAATAPPPPIPPPLPAEPPTTPPGPQPTYDRRPAVLTGVSTAPQARQTTVSTPGPADVEIPPPPSSSSISVEFDRNRAILERLLNGEAHDLIPAIQTMLLTADTKTYGTYFFDQRFPSATLLTAVINQCVIASARSLLDNIGNENAEAEHPESVDHLNNLVAANLLNLQDVGLNDKALHDLLEYAADLREKRQTRVAPPPQPEPQPELSPAVLAEITTLVAAAMEASADNLFPLFELQRVLSENKVESLKLEECVLAKIKKILEKIRDGEDPTFMQTLLSDMMQDGLEKEMKTTVDQELHELLLEQVDALYHAEPLKKEDIKNAMRTLTCLVFQLNLGEILESVRKIVIESYIEQKRKKPEAKQLIIDLKTHLKDVGFYP